MKREHRLKTLQPYFDDLAFGNKNFELRKDDRNFQIGDLLILEEYINEQYTDRYLTAEITYKLNGGVYGLSEGYCILGMLPCDIHLESRRTHP